MSYKVKSTFLVHPSVLFLWLPPQRQLLSIFKSSEIVCTHKLKDRYLLKKQTNKKTHEL